MRAAVNPLPGTPLPNGILGGCVPVEEVSGDRLHELAGGVEWLTLGCAPVGVWKDPCACSDESDGEDEESGDAEKTFHRPEIEKADPITVYAGVECSTMGFSYREAVEQAQMMLALGQQRAVEEGFARSLARKAIDLTPDGDEGGEAVDIAQALAVLEGHLAEFYGGAGYLVIPAGLAAILGRYNLIHRDPETGCLSTLAGNRVIISAGAAAVNVGPDGEEAAAGEAWMSITGPISVTLGPAEVVPPNGGASIDTRYNTVRALVERTALVRTTCQSFTVRASL